MFFLILFFSSFQFVWANTQADDFGAEINEKIAKLELQLNNLRQEAIVNKAGEDKKRQLIEMSELYHQAYDYLMQQKLDWAEEIFNKIILDYDGRAFAAFSRFWMGEIYFYRKDYVNASLAYGKSYNYLKKIDDNHLSQTEFKKTPEIMVKLAFALKMIGKPADACLVIKKMQLEYPNIQDNLSWFLEKLVRDLKCKN